MKSLIAGLCLLLTSCTLLKNLTKTRQEETESTRMDTEVQSLSEVNRDLKSTSVSFHRDSGNLKYMVELWPKGNFVFSPQSGFKGEASKILISGSASNVSLGGSLMDRHDQGQEKAKTVLKKKIDNKAKNVVAKTNRSVSWKWIIAVIVTLTIFLLGRFRLKLW